MMILGSDMTKKKRKQIIKLAEKYIEDFEIANKHSNHLCIMGDYGYATHDMAATAMILVEIMLNLRTEI
jgi:hypothetical protein